LPQNQGGGEIMELTKYLVLEGTRISLYNRRDVLTFDVQQFGDDGCRIFELQNHAVLDYYEEIKLEEV
jgi:hypothetical protein